MAKYLNIKRIRYLLTMKPVRETTRHRIGGFADVDQAEPLGRATSTARFPLPGRRLIIAEKGPPPGGRIAESPSVTSSGDLARKTAKQYRSKASPSDSRGPWFSVASMGHTNVSKASVKAKAPNRALASTMMDLSWIDPVDGLSKHGGLVKISE